MAVGADSTGIRVTWTHADFVATDLITGAIVVARAARAGNPWPIHFRGVALDAGIALEALRAIALGIVISCGTLSINATPLQSAGIQAISIRADLGIGTLGVVLTAGDDLGYRDGHTVAGDIRHRVTGTLAGHGALGKGIQNRASLLRSANMWRGTRISATLIDAGQFRWTVGILGTLRLWRLHWYIALNMRVALVSGSALALRLMATTHTDGVQGTGLLVTNRTAHAIQSIAGLVVCTILVVLTVSSDAGDEGIALSSGWTDAHSLVVLGQALGSTAAAHLAMCAGIHAVLVQAGLVIRTVGIDLALSWKYIDYIIICSS